jgi:tetratricopeptide (TPR) repeat protein
LHTSRLLKFALFALALGLTPAAALAACSPGQMQEAQIQFQGAQQLLQAQQWQQAIPQLRSIVEFCEEYFPALRGLGMAHMELEQYAEAESAFQRVIEVRGSEADAADFANLAKVLTKEKKYKEARAEYIKAKARDAKNRAVLVNLGILHNASGYPEEAVATLEDALAYYPELAPQVTPHLAKASTEAAERQKKLGNTERAAAYLLKAREYGGAAGGSSLYKQIQQRMQAQEYAQAIALCDELLAEDPEHANALLTKARAADALGQEGVAIEAYKKYTALRPDNLDEIAAMIIVMAEDGRCVEAEAAAQEALEDHAGLGRKALGKLNFAYGKALFCSEEYAGARTQFQLAANSGDDYWAGPARQGMNACDEYLEYQSAQRRQAAQENGR